MANFRTWIEKTRVGNFLVRSCDIHGKRKTHYCIEKYESAYLTDSNGQKRRYVGKSLANRYAELVKENNHQHQFGECDLTLEIDPLIEDYSDDQLAHNLSMNTVIHRRMSLQALIRETDMRRLFDMTDENIRAWRLAMIKNKFSIETIRGRLADLRTFLNYLIERKQLFKSPFGAKMIPSKKATDPKFYSTAEFLALERAILQIRKKDLARQVQLACHLARSAGLRKVEMLGNRVVDRDRLQHADLARLPDGSLKIHLRPEIVKGQKHGRDIPVVDPQLIALLGNETRGPVLTMAVNQLDYYFSVARKKAGINAELDIHGLRHTFAKDFLQGGGSMSALMDLMGHLDPKTTKIYSQFENSYLKESMSAAYKRRDSEKILAGQLQGNFTKPMTRIDLERDSMRLSDTIAFNGKDESK